MSEPAPFQQIDRTYVRCGGRKLSYFAGCDYFRLASHPKVLQAMTDGLEKYGLNVAASRMTTGNHKIFGELEKSLSQFFKAESAVLVSNGYVTNLIVAQALAGEFSDVLIDEKAHPSLKDAAKFFQTPVHIFRNRDVEDLKRVLKSLRKNVKPCLLTDGMFSSDGSLSPLASYLQILPRNGWLLVDDAHGAGTFGKTGGGNVEREQIDRSRVIQTVTLSKAFGTYGGAILGTRILREKILARSGMFVGSTPPPLPLVNAALTAVEILRTDKAFRPRLFENVFHLRLPLKQHGVVLPEQPSPIFPIVPKDRAEAEMIRKRCLKNGVFPPFIKYPGGPKDGYFRFVISSEHTKVQLDALLRSLV